MNQAIQSEGLFSSALHKGTPSFLVENHDEAYYLWREAGVRQATLVHVDAHHDMWPSGEGGATTVGNYVFRAMREEIVGNVFWVVPDSSFATKETRGVLLRNLHVLPDLKLLEVSESQIRAGYCGHAVTVCRARDLPRVEAEVLLDVDTDYFVLPHVSAPEANEVPEHIPWAWPQDLLAALTGKLTVSMLTIAYSVNGGTTPLRWKYLGEEFRDRYAGEACQLKCFELIQQAALARQAGGLERSKGLLLAATTAAPHHPAARWHLAESCQDLNDMAQAQASYSNAVSADPSYACEYNNAGPCLEAAGRLEEAEAEYTRILRLHPNNSQALSGLGRVAVEKRDWHEAQELLLRALSIDAKDIETHRLLGDVSLALHDPPSAVAGFENYLSLLKEGRRSLGTPISTHEPGEDIQELAVRAKLAELYRHKGELLKAEEQLRWLGRRRVPNTPIAGIRMSLSSVLMRQKRLPESLLAAFSALSAIPVDALRLARKLDRFSDLRDDHPVKNAFLNMLRTGVTFLSGMVTSAILARSLGPPGMGVYSYTLWVAGVMVGLCHFGLPTALSKFLAERLGKNDAHGAAGVARRLLKLQLVVILCVVSAGAMVLLLSKTDFPWLFALLLVAPMALQQALVNALMGAHDYHRLARIGAWGAIVQVISVVVVAVLGGSLTWFLAAVLAANLFLTVLYAMHLRSLPLMDTTLNGRKDPGLGYPALLRFSGPVAYLVFLDMIVWQRSEVWFLRRYSFWQEIAFYSIAYLMIGRLTEVLVSVTSTLLPLQARESVSGPGAIAKIQEQALCMLQMFLWPVCFCAALAAKPLISALYGDSYLQVWPVFAVLLISPFAISLTDVSVASIYAVDRQRSLMLPLTMTAVLNLFLAYLFVPKWGAVGAAAANSSAQLAEAMFLLLFSSSILSTRVPWKKLLKIHALALLCFMPSALITYFGFSTLAVGMGLACSCIAYLFLLWKSGELTLAGRPEVLHAHA